MTYEPTSDEFVELFTMELRPDKIKPFIDAREEVDTFLSTLDGFIGTEVLLLSEYQLMVLLRWRDADHFNKALPLMTRSEILRKWLGRSTSCSQRPAISK